MSADNSSQDACYIAELDNRCFLRLLKIHLDGFNQAVEDGFFSTAHYHLNTISAMRSLSNIVLQGDFVDESLSALYFLLLAAIKKSQSEGALK
ncbi:hypothetical protein HQQ94_08255 [Shewanella sp. VB17]|uniref:hypothetical protein n=1 Tax=Shewanella sp. VB17 TaxID=2739432 RepID=UPI0015677EB0|nr:hypothetical protein [Shewanella sp. VB17]NRD73234.1 hypothetical protein [Shewanella sp. VB17]